MMSSSELAARALVCYHYIWPRTSFNTTLQKLLFEVYFSFTKGVQIEN
jgi:hypothetical protein